MKTFRFLLPVLAALLAGNALATTPKHAFRGAWMHIIGQRQFARMSTQETQDYLVDQLDKLQQAGCNAVIWQIRPQSDAAYISDLEPWSRWITGEAGTPPNPLWDPLQFMVDEAHKRGMELHAWINPYRVTSDKNEQPPQGHIYYEHPEWFVNYADGKIYFDPGLPECRDFINKVVADIVTRYDIDAIHMDDYFYPYPVDDADFPDDASYNKYGLGWDRGDWRRNNVDRLIMQLHHTIKDIKPWVRLGISPFGIWRNKANDVNGSNTNGLQCYDQLYADCPRWTAMGWVDNMVHQLYWELEHQRANGEEQSHWEKHHATGRHMYYGMSVNNVMDHRDIAQEKGDTLNPTQLDHRTRINRSLPNVQGPCWWPGYSITRNYKGVMDSLANTHQSTPAIIPPYYWLDSIAPDPVSDLKVKKKKNQLTLSWTPAASDDPLQQPVRFVIYRFKRNDIINLNNSDAIVALTGLNSITLTLDKKDKNKWQFAVTALDRCNNESLPTIIH